MLVGDIRYRKNTSHENSFSKKQHHWKRLRKAMTNILSVCAKVARKVLSRQAFLYESIIMSRGLDKESITFSSVSPLFAFKRIEVQCSSKREQF